MIRVTKPGKLRLAVLASGRGSNFDALCRAVESGDLNAELRLLISDKKEALAIKKAKSRGIKPVYIEPAEFPNREEYEKTMVRILNDHNINMVALAGYMRLVGSTFLQAFNLRVVNIHPALLPSFTGLHAQKQALDYGVRYSGCTVHIVDAGMDTGPIIMQSVVPVYQDDTEESLSSRILVEEHKIYWRALQLFAEGRIFIDGHKVIIK
jgi:phosphoribosylglycinamide formyltransferase-1